MKTAENDISRIGEDIEAVLRLQKRIGHGGIGEAKTTIGSRVDTRTEIAKSAGEIDTDTNLPGRNGDGESDPIRGPAAVLHVGIALLATTAANDVPADPSLPPAPGLLAHTGTACTDELKILQKDTAKRPSLANENRPLQLQLCATMTLIMSRIL